MDVTGAAALRALVGRLTRRGIVVMMSGVQDQPRSVLERTGILDEVTRQGDHLFDDTSQAIAHARQHLANHDHTHPTRPAEHSAAPPAVEAGKPVPPKAVT